jgi:hypothetical protein
MGLYHFEEGKIVEMWLVNDILGFSQQLGAIPPLGEGEAYAALSYGGLISASIAVSRRTR